MEGKRIPPPPPPRRDVIGESSNSINNNFQSKTQTNLKPIENANQQTVEKKKFYLGEKTKNALLIIGAVVFLLGAVASFIMLFI